MSEELAQPSAEKPESQALRQQLEQTRSEIAAKLESLQKRMSKSVDTTRASVEETMRFVKQIGQDAARSIKNTFDLKRQAARHPWSLLGIATCAGAMLAQRGLRGRCRDAQTRMSGLRKDEASIHAETAETATPTPRT